MKVALIEFGIHERTALGSKRVVEYHSTIMLHAHSDQVAWCASVIGWCLKQAGYNSTHSAAAAIYANYGTAIDPPGFGCIVQIRHAKSGHDRSTGSSSGNHFDFLVTADAAHIELLGGSQSDAVKISLLGAEIQRCRLPVVSHFEITSRFL